MDLHSLNDIFTKSIFRIPDYQRGYAWQETQYREMWEDIVNLEDGKKHYTGMITLQKLAPRSFDQDTVEHWLLKDHGFNIYHVVDGQQRLTTSIIIIQAMIDMLQEKLKDSQEEIYMGSLSIQDIIEQYIMREKKPEKLVKTYMFGYSKDNPSYLYMKHRILKESGAGTIDETYYTLNLQNALTFYHRQWESIFNEEDRDGVQRLFNKITQNLVYNKYEISDDFNVHVAFETMNNRGKKLSNLELLKNRLIFLSSIYPDSEIKPDERTALNQKINDAWKEVYHQLGRNKISPLNDNELLRAHWITYYQYSRQTGYDYIDDLLNSRFHPSMIHKKKLEPVELEQSKEIVDELEAEEAENGDAIDIHREVSLLKPSELEKYVLSIKAYSLHWFYSFFPEFANDYTKDEKEWLDKINRIGSVYFRPMIATLFLKVNDPKLRVEVLKAIERFIFIAFRLSQARSNYRSSEFYNASRQLYWNDINPQDIIDKLNNNLKDFLASNNTLESSGFSESIKLHFKNRFGFYSWYPLSYFLYEYELELTKSRGQRKIDWKLFIRNERDKISIEHIYPQSEAKDCWKKAFKGYKELQKHILRNSLGNLLPLSSSINSSLQDHCFVDKRNGIVDADPSKSRNGYSNGSYSEIEVSSYDDWNAQNIKERGLKLINFMEKRWNIKLGNEEEKINLLHIDFAK